MKLALGTRGTAVMVQRFTWHLTSPSVKAALVERERQDWAQGCRCFGDQLSNRRPCFWTPPADIKLARSGRRARASRVRVQDGT